MLPRVTSPLPAGPLCVYCGADLGCGFPTRAESEQLFAAAEVGSLAYFRAAQGCGVGSPSWLVAQGVARSLGRELAS